MKTLDYRSLERHTIPVDARVSIKVVRKSRKDCPFRVECQGIYVYGRSAIAWTRASLKKTGDGGRAYTKWRMFASAICSCREADRMKLVLPAYSPSVISRWIRYSRAYHECRPS